jgi:3-deoxy-D-manno-octulosonic-acid transferase
MMFSKRTSIRACHGGRWLILAYNILFVAAAALAFPLVFVNVLTSPKRKKTFFGRLGFQCLEPFNVIRPVWVHALSVGEVLSSIPLIRAIRKRCPRQSLVVSVSTLTGHGIAESVLGNDVDLIFYFPYDFLWSVRKMIEKIDPAVFFLIESDIWPNFLFEMKRKRKPVVLVNGRISPRSFRGYRRFSFFMRAVFSWISVICVQSRTDAERFKSLGVPSDKVFVAGNVKFDQTVDTVPSDDVRRMRARMHIKPDQKVLLAGSTHEGEESALLDTFFRLKKELGRIVLVVVPRDPQRSKTVRKLVSAFGGTATTLSELESEVYVGPKDVVVVDTMGVLSRLYALSDVAFVGGSLVTSGGHNPLEPAAYAKPVVFGRDMSDFSSVAAMLIDNGGAIQVEGRDQLFRAIKGLLDDGKLAEATGRRAFEVFQSNKGAVEKTIRASEAFLK